MTDMLDNQQNDESSAPECGCGCCQQSECDSAAAAESVEEVSESAAPEDTAAQTESAPEQTEFEAEEQADADDQATADQPAAASDSDKPVQPAEDTAAPAVETKSKSRTPLIIAIVLVVVALVLGGIWLVRTNDAVANALGISTDPLDGKHAVMTLGSYEVSRDEYLYYMLSGYEQIEAYYPGVLASNTEMFDMLKESIESSLKQSAAVECWAKDLGVELDESEIAEVDDYIASVRASYTNDEEYEAALSAAHLTEDLYRQLLLEQDLSSKVSQAALDDAEFSEVSDDDVREYAEENEIIGAKHILLLTSGDEENDAKVLARAQDLLDRINAGEDFDTLMNENTEDPGIESYPDGYTFGPDSMVDEFDSAARALEIGEVSEIVQTSYGYHIIKRIEPDYDSLKSSVVSDRITTTLEDYAEKLKVKYARGYDEITLEDCIAAGGGTTEGDATTDDTATNGTDSAGTTASQG